MKVDEVNIFVRKIVGANAKRLREEQDLSQSKLALMAGVNRSHLNQFEGGNQNISVELLVKLADSLDVPITDFFENLGGASPLVIYKETQVRNEK